MKNLVLTLEEEIFILNKYKLTSNELMFIRTLLLLQDDGDEDIFQKYIESLHECNISIKEIIKSLQEKGCILKGFHCPEEGEAFDPYEIPINKIFIKNLYKSSFELGKELFDNYPQFGTINGNIVPLRSIARHFNSLEDAYSRYGRSIKWNGEKHEQIIELLKWASDGKNILNCSLSSFIINQGWLDLAAMKNGDLVNVNYDAVKML
jgi:hypothetical protein